MRPSIHGTVARLLTGLLLATAVAACGTASAPNPFRGDGAPPAFDPSKITPNEITHEEIQTRGKNDLTAMALIRRLRPGWLAARGQTSFTSGQASYPVIYIDEVRRGGLPTLHRIPAAEIERLEFYNTADATTRWGTGHRSGVINIVTGRS